MVQRGGTILRQVRVRQKAVTPFNTGVVSNLPQMESINITDVYHGTDNTSSRRTSH